jgi:hypothetical protein
MLRSTMYWVLENRQVLKPYSILARSYIVRRGRSYEYGGILPVPLRQVVRVPRQFFL